MYNIRRVERGGNVSQYENFAYIYDELMSEVDYDKWLEYILKTINEKPLESKMLAEIGCGTGTMSILLAKKGYEMIGLDLSEDMLMVAREKALDEELDILFLQQDMTTFELFGSVDAIVSSCDSMNYIHPSEISKVFERVHFYLNPGGVFIFDLNTRYKFMDVYHNQTFSEVGEDFAYIWENEYNEEEESNEYDITFFVEDEDIYLRFDEYHKEYVHSIELLKTYIEAAGLKFVKAVDDYSDIEFNSKTERVTIIVTKE